jgi:RNA polymerase sigma-70 factor (ECF subfamily)
VFESCYPQFRNHLWSNVERSGQGKPAAVFLDFFLLNLWVDILVRGAELSIVQDHENDAMENDLSSDAELMSRVGRGDMAALGRLAERHGSRIRAFSYRLLGDWHKAEDVAQETFLRLRQAARKYEPQARFSTWLYRIVYNLSIDQQRRAVREPVSLEAAQIEQEDPSTGDSLETAELARQVQNAVNSLPPRQRQVVLLHRYEGFSHGEISEVTGWSKSAVESLLVRAYDNLRKKLAEYEDFAR